MRGWHRAVARLLEAQGTARPTQRQTYHQAASYLAKEGFLRRVALGVYEVTDSGRRRAAALEELAQAEGGLP